jgi:hypothetical protein
MTKATPIDFWNVSSWSKTSVKRKRAISEPIN